MYVVYILRHRYTVSRLDSAKKAGLEIISIHKTYRQAEAAAVKLTQEKGGFKYKTGSK